MRQDESLLSAMHAIGRIGLTRLNPQHLERLYADRIDAGLAPATVRQFHAVLRLALGQANKWGVIARNVASMVTPPRVERREMTAYTGEQARSLLDSAHGDQFEALYVFAITTGIRQGELLALRWRDVDMDSANIQVRGSLQRTEDGLKIVQPKTSTSKRQRSPLPRLSPMRCAATERLRRNGACNMERPGMTTIFFFPMRLAVLWIPRTCCAVRFSHS